MKITCDFETANPECDVTEVGAAVYWAHPKTEVLCLCAIQNEFEVAWIPGENDEVLEIFRAWAASPDVRFEAHNVSFEWYGWQWMMERYKMPPIPINRWVDTMAQAYYRGLPGGLDAAGKAVGLSIEKDKVGRDLTLSLSKPMTQVAWMEQWDGRENKAAWKRKFPKGFLDRSRKTLRRVSEYCVIDCRVEKTLGEVTGELSPYEQRVWELDQRINQRGIKIDRIYIQNSKRIVAAASAKLEVEFGKLTGGLAVGQVAKIKDWCNERGANLPSLGKDVLKAHGIVGLEEDEDDVRSVSESLLPDVSRVLGIRAVLGSSSIKKLDKMLLCAGADDRIRYSIQYHGAGTGRWAGRLFQPQNFPRGKIDGGHDPEQLVKAINTGDAAYVGYLFGDPIAAVASGLRHALVPASGNLFCVGDFAGIEARIVLALAGQHDKTTLMASGVDVYADLASVIYGRHITKADVPERQAGKSGVLGCGFQCGPPNFNEKFLGGKDIETAERVVQTYRTQWAPLVPRVWAGLEEAALKAMAGTPSEAYGVRYELEPWESWLGCHLPDGQIMWYYDPQPDTGRFGGEAWSYMAWKNGQWKRVQAYGGLLTENVVQKLARGLLVEAMYRLEDNGFPVVLTVHDEIVSEVPVAQVDQGAFEQIMAEPTAFSKSIKLPIAVEGWSADRYRK